MSLLTRINLTTVEANKQIIIQQTIIKKNENEI